MSRSAAWAVGLGLVAAPGCASLEQAQPVTPQRPTLSSDPNTTARGTFEVEAGLAWDEQDSKDSPVTIKYGAGERTEVFVATSPLLELEVTGGLGDLFLGTRHRFWEREEEQASAAGQLVVKIPTASESRGLGSGEFDLFGSAMAMKGLGRFTGTGYLQLGLLGDPEGGADLQPATALSGGYSITDRISGYAELAGIFQPESADLAFLTLGASYAVSPSLVFDLGSVVGSNPASPDLIVTVGLTTNLGPIFGARAAAETASAP